MPCQRIVVPRLKTVVFVRKWRHWISNIPRRSVSCVSTGLAALGANNVRSRGAGFVHMFGVADHVHVQDAVGV